MEEAVRKTSVKDLAERFGGSVQSRASAPMSETAPKDSGFKVCNGIHVSAQDDREYRALTLPNRLEVLLIHDANTDKGSAALDVNVGHFKDPAEFPGLAHFCEHMLFLGTKKYPDENSYSAFLNEHGGSSNAWTSMENTNFYFDVTHPYLLDALDRFAQFFVAPLFTEGATERELNAVDSENAKNLQSDTWRLMQLFRSGANSTHPFSKYGTGNLQTLRDDPRSQGLDVRAALLKLHQQYYSANLMRLVVLGRESLDQLQSAVEGLFCDVRNSDVPVPSFGTEPYGDEQLCTEVHAVPIKDQRIIELAFFMPAQWQRYTTKPSSILSHLVGHEGAGSLLSLLKSRGWVNELSAGLWNDNHDFASFSIYLEATSQGIEEAHEVVECCFGYLNMLRAARGGASGNEWMEQWVFEEVQAVNAMNFRFKAKEDPSSYTSWLAGQMQKVKPEHFVSGGSLFYEYDPVAIGAALDFLVPSRCVLTLVSKTFEAEGQTDSEEKWYGTKYRRSKIDDALLTHWASVAPADGLRLPDRNDLISTDFTLVSQRAPGTAESLEQGYRGALPKPLELSEPSLVRGWFKEDDVFNKPKLSVMLNLFSPKAYESAESVVLADLFVRHTKEMLQEYSYMAEMASMNYVLQPTIQGMELYVSGFSQKLELLLNAVLRVVAACEVKDALFERVKDKARRKYENFKKEQPYQHAMYNSSFALQVPRIHNDAKVEAIASISADDLRRFGKQLIDRMFVEGLVHGNIDESGARALLESTVSALAFRRVLGPPQRDIRCVQLKRICDGGTGYAVRRQAQNEDDENSAVEVIFQVGRQESHITSMKLELLAHIIREPAFDQLRTKEQLGYLVWSGTHGMCATEGLRFIVQSDKFDAAYLDGRIEALLGNGLEDGLPVITAEQPAAHTGDEEDGTDAAVSAKPACFGSLLREMTEEQFAEHVDAVVAKKLEKDKTPWQETLRHWREITDMTYVFDRSSVEAAALRKLKKEDISEFYQKFIARGAPCRARLTSQLFGGSRAIPPAPPIASDANASIATQIDDVEAFKRSMPLFPGRALGNHAKM